MDFNQGGKSIRDNRAAASVTSGLICVFLRTWRERERERERQKNERELIDLCYKDMPSPMNVE